MLQGKTALVTGSTSGIGLGIAKALAKQGANIVLNGFGDAAGPQAEIAALGVKVAYHGADMTKPAEIDAMVKFAEAEKVRKAKHGKALVAAKLKYLDAEKNWNTYASSAKNKAQLEADRKKAAAIGKRQNVGAVLKSLRKSVTSADTAVQTEAAELGNTYELQVVPIPTNRPTVRDDMGQQVLRGERSIRTGMDWAE